MCQIILKRGPESHFSNRQFKNTISRNDDGMGIMYRKDGRVMVHKLVGKAHEQFQLFKDLRHLPVWALHVRFKTHGLIDEANCHPYKVLSIDDGDPIDLYMMHNGVIHIDEVDKEKSDTWHFVEYVIKPIVKANVDLLWENEFIQDVITKFIGGSKLLFMRSDDVEHPILILNANLGYERTGCWLSNLLSEDNWYNNRQTVTPPLRDVAGRTRCWNSVTNAWEYRYGDARDNAPFRVGATNQSTETTGSTSSSMSQEEFEEQWEKALQERHLDDILGSSVYTADKSHSGLYLPNQEECDKIIHLTDNKKTPKQYIVENPDKDWLCLLGMLRSQGDDSIRSYIETDPADVANMIMALYRNNTMTYNNIMTLFKSKRGVDGMVKLIQNMQYEVETKEKARLTV